ncbi:glycosyltransferase family 4 protein [Desulfuribacillus alkaliarsenatis]|uniref:Glycosyltransferase n=1 Tax=Desulfuribacillus alkaliarsenatis TaxID=766136 RepID=A0A1E5G1L6_9FIRM|nr:glycosyltransferase family 4 protein [Desulfuribacillus alkaliarsenatis]OEF96809.1 hypothetical protein BHF68_07040 [Desulfuribacillus alkaliarsenatis]
MRILHIIGGGEYGGAEQYLVNLARKLQGSPYQIQMACFYDSEFAAVLRKYQIPVHTVLPSSRFDFTLAQKLRRLMIQEKIDIVHTHGVRANFFGRLAARKLKLPIATTVHSELRQDYQNPVAYMLALGMERMTQPLTTRYIAISNSIKQDMIKRGIPEQKIEVIYSGIDFAEFVEEKTSTLELPQPPVIGIVGRLQEVKGHRYAIMAMPAILQKYPEVNLVIIGDGPLKEDLMKLAKQIQVADNVHFLGFQQSVSSLLNQFDIFLMPSLSEGLGLSLIEAMSQGIPVIASEVGGMVDVVQDTGDLLTSTGILVSAKDANAIAENAKLLLADSNIAQQMGMRGQADVLKRFNSERMIAEIADFYEKL